jgi:hypothetical protein
MPISGLLPVSYGAAPSTQPHSTAAEGQAIYHITVPNRAGVVTSFSMAVYCESTNSATNYYGVELRDGANAILSTWNTSAIPANTWSRIGSTLNLSFGGSTASSDVLMYVIFNSALGNPGPSFWTAAPNIFFK